MTETPMDLLLVRHAAAAPYSPETPDADRPLTPRGRRRFRRCVVGLEHLGITLGRVLHSPLVRAVQTAEELAPLLKGESEVTPLLAAAPGSELLSALPGPEPCALVGHEPWMSELLSLLLVGVGAAPTFAFKKGAVAWLRGEPEPGAMELRAFLTPRVLVELGE